VRVCVELEQIRPAESVLDLERHHPAAVDRPAEQSAGRASQSQSSVIVVVFIATVAAVPVRY
jgi:hypothetical protein